MNRKNIRIALTDNTAIIAQLDEAVRKLDILAARCAEVEAERDRLQNIEPYNTDYCHISKDAIVRERDEARRAAVRYGWHDESCMFLDGVYPCDCGFEELRKRWSRNVQHLEEDK